MLPITDFKKSRITKNQPKKSFGTIRIKILVVFAVLVSALFFTQLVFANNLATDGQKLSNVQEEIASLEQENTTLKVEIAKASSLTSLSQKAKQTGYSKPAHVITP